MEIVLEKYNYWIIILLMMGGLYIVFESQNLIKRLVGLSIFQTSVIFLYVTLGKIAGGTAPIFISSPHGDDHHGDAAGHGDSAGHGAEAGTAHAAENTVDHSNTASHGHEGGDAAHHELAAPVHDTLEGAHEVVHGDGVSAAVDAATQAHSAAQAGAHHAPDATHAAAEIIYTNPLPHVLMLTAIVVGVATLSVGLALVVRIREAYGTIEMDDVNAADLAVCETEGEKA
ncbi:sodium:proton antiporter [Hirschia litorea]|uniref:Sodium:proton antiporter n=1 Tax=Hirschia litorea TaxID=1199156 RepID=A0ABW2IJ12_9PROT